MADFLINVGILAFTAMYCGIALYGETQRHKSNFWRGYTDISGGHLIWDWLDRRAERKKRASLTDNGSLNTGGVDAD